MTEHQPRPAHSRFGGSSCSRWMSCPGSVALIASVPPSPDSPYAAEGTVAHKLGELCLSEDLHPRHYLGEAIHEKYPNIVVTAEMCDAVVVYLNAVLTEKAQTRTGELYVEHSFDLSIAKGDAYGTNDALIYHPETGRLVIFDYKHGAGVSVTAEDNAQLKFYAAGAAFSRDDWKVTSIKLVIVQPRARDADEIGAIREWEFDTLDLFEFMEQAGAAIALAKRAKIIHDTDSHTPFAREKAEEFKTYLQTGDHCRWCDAGGAGVCPIRDGGVLQEIEKLDTTLAFAGVQDISPSALPEINSSYDPATLGAILAGIEALSGWGSQIRDYIQGQLQSGVKVPGWKLVETQARRKWAAADEDVAGYLALSHDIDMDALLPRKLVTIGEAERLLKAALPADKLKEAKEDLTLRFTIKESSGVTLAPDSDKRPAVDAVERAFAGVNTDGL